MTTLTGCEGPKAEPFDRPLHYIDQFPSDLRSPAGQQTAAPIPTFPDGFPSSALFREAEKPISELPPEPMPTLGSGRQVDEFIVSSLLNQEQYAWLLPLENNNTPALQALDFNPNGRGCDMQLMNFLISEDVSSVSTLLSTGVVTETQQVATLSDRRDSCLDIREHHCASVRESGAACLDVAGEAETSTSNAPAQLTNVPSQANFASTQEFGDINWDCSWGWYAG